jgi:hypothetical protein
MAIISDNEKIIYIINELYKNSVSDVDKKKYKKILLKLISIQKRNTGK